MERIYLDHNATTRPLPEVVQGMNECLSRTFGNPASLHAEGRAARAVVDLARARVAALVNAAPDEVIFVSGGSEADALAVQTLAFRDAVRNHVVVTAIEHRAVLVACRALEQRGIEVTLVPPGNDGVVTLAAVAAALTDRTGLVAVMLANNDVGTLQPVSEIAALAHSRGAFVHVDAVQAAGRVPVDFRALGVDTLALSAHKLYGPKGVGALVVRLQALAGVVPAAVAPVAAAPRTVPLQSGPMRLGTARLPSAPGTMAGAGPIRLTAAAPAMTPSAAIAPPGPAALPPVALPELRHAGTPNVAGVMGFGLACEIAAERLARRDEHDRRLRDKLESGLRDAIPSIRVNGNRERRLPNTLSVSFDNADGVALAAALDRSGIAVSTGAACNGGGPSHVLRAMGYPVARITGSLRFSVGEANTQAEIARTIAAVVDAVMAL
jgi:cysteine desulfurase